VESLTFERFELPKVNKPSRLIAISTLDKLKPSSKDNLRTEKNLLPNQERPTVQQKEPRPCLNRMHVIYRSVGRQSAANRDGMKSMDIKFDKNKWCPFYCVSECSNCHELTQRCRLVLSCKREGSSNREQEASLTFPQDDGATRFYCASLIQSNICRPFS